LSRKSCQRDEDQGDLEHIVSIVPRKQFDAIVCVTIVGL